MTRDTIAREPGIKGCGRTPLQVQAWGETTLKGNTLYLHVFEWPKNGQLVLGGVKAKVKRAYLLSDKRKMLKTLGKIMLNPGVYELWIKAKEITGDELFRCKNIVLKPL